EVWVSSLVQLFRFKAALREGARPCHGLLSQAEATRMPAASFPQPFYTSANTHDPRLNAEDDEGTSRRRYSPGRDFMRRRLGARAMCRPDDMRARSGSRLSIFVTLGLDPRVHA